MGYWLATPQMGHAPAFSHINTTNNLSTAFSRDDKMILVPPA
jgi:hypothetical protein